MIAHDNTTSFTQPTANASGAAIPEHRLPHDNNRGGGGGIPSNHEISIVEGSANPSSSIFYESFAGYSQAKQLCNMDQQ